VRSSILDEKVELREIPLEPTRQFELLARYRKIGAMARCRNAHPLRF
jgi:hypothetical protein